MNTHPFIQKFIERFWEYYKCYFKNIKVKDNAVALYYLDYWFSKIDYDEEREMYYSYINKMWYDGKNWVRPFDKVFDRDGEEFVLKADDSYVYSLPAYKEDVCNYPEYSLYQDKIAA